MKTLNYICDSFCNETEITKMEWTMETNNNILLVAMADRNDTANTARKLEIYFNKSDISFFFLKVLTL